MFAKFCRLCLLDKCKSLSNRAVAKTGLGNREGKETAETEMAIAKRSGNRKREVGKRRREVAREAKRRARKTKA